VTYTCGAGSLLTVGNLDVGRQFFTGLIAEILLYDSVSASQRSAVKGYLQNKYGGFTDFLQPSNLICRRTGESEVELSWTNHASYESIRIRRDGQHIAQLGSTVTSYTDSSAPAGTPEYQVLAVDGGEQGGPSCEVSASLPEVTLTAATVFGSDAAGHVIPAKRWNTGPIDIAWDVGIGSGDIPSSAASASFLNSSGSCSVDIPLAFGENRFWFTVAGGGLEYNGMNLYFDGDESEDRPGISVFGRVDTPGSRSANSANTMGWPITDVPGSGRLVYANGAVRVIMTDWFVNSAPNGVDLVSEQGNIGNVCIATAGGDGVPDLVGGFTLTVAEQGITSLTGATFFGADANGTVIDTHRWNAGPFDPAWDLVVGSGDVPPDNDSADFLSGLDECLLDVPLELGDNHFFFTVAGGALDFSGMNLYFDGLEAADSPGISVFGPADSTLYSPNFSTTMGWPLSHVAGAGTLLYTNGAVTVRLTDWSYTSEDSGVDLIRPQTAVGGPPCVYTRGGDGARDVVGRFTLSVEEGTVGVFQPRRFVDVTAAMNLPLDLAFQTAAWADFNNDGWVDLAVDGGLYRNNEGTSFTKIQSFQGGIETFGGYNNDGLMDLFVAFAPHDVGLYQNNGAAFVDVRNKIPSVPSDSMLACLWGDYNLDGLLDIYITGYENPNYDPDSLLFQVPGGTFEVVWQEGGRVKPSRAASAADWDEDGDLDIYVANYRLERNYLFRNNGLGAFENVAETTHSIVGGVGPEVAAGHSSGVVWADLNSDGHLDLIVANLAHPWGLPTHDKTKVYRNLGPTTDFNFEDRGDTHGIEYSETHAAPSVADVDNDGHLDLWITTFGYGQNPVSTFYRGRGDFTFGKVSPRLGLTHAGGNL
jgi:hypothetical protein